jgi:hypothetical protein
VAVDRAWANPDRPWVSPRVPHGAREIVNKFLQAFAQWIEKNIAK